MKVNELLLKRRSAALYDVNHNISDEEILTITEAMRLSPSAYNLLSWRTVVVKRNKELRDVMLPMFYNQKNVRDASAIVFIIVSNYDKFLDNDIPDLINRLVDNDEERNLKYEEFLTKSLNIHKNDSKLASWPLKEGYIALGTSLATAEEIGIDTCAIEGMSKEKLTTFLQTKKLIESNEELATVLLLGKIDRSQKKSFKEKKIRLEKEKFTKIIG
ncbi:nitroreductase family protein [Spiroplasma endosymbiont of Othius punctulatus]|uniref:nitroreductase family protein n=1 Tax=Spiroplasma endosymbiont of Othius punctulatus TaxID=3066289 RepID=UPI0030CFCC92